MSDKPVAERLQVKKDRRLAVFGASPELDRAIGAMDARGELSQAEVVLLATPDRATLEAVLPKALGEVQNGAILWVAYPKLSSRLALDLSRDVIRDLAPRFGLDTVSQIAIDADWSALRLKRI